MILQIFIQTLISALQSLQRVGSAALIICHILLLYTICHTCTRARQAWELRHSICNISYRASRIQTLRTLCLNVENNFTEKHSEVRNTPSFTTVCETLSAVLTAKVLEMVVHMKHKKIAKYLHKCSPICWSSIILYLNMLDHNHLRHTMITDLRHTKFKVPRCNYLLNYAFCGIMAGQEQSDATI